MLDVMVDLETLGVRPGSAIVSIGAVAFDPAANQLAAGSYYAVVNLASTLSLGATIDPDTLAWWKRQKPEAREVVFDALAGGVSQADALRGFAAYLQTFGDRRTVRLWSNGSDFDNVLLIAAFRQAGLEIAWSPFNHRCFRTLKSLFPGREPPREGLHHNALADAVHQARWALAILSARRAL